MQLIVRLTLIAFLINCSRQVNLPLDPSFSPPEPDTPTVDELLRDRLIAISRELDAIQRLVVRQPLEAEVVVVLCYCLVIVITKLGNDR